MSGNYLRVRGEYELTELLENDVMELPPRARRILVNALLQYIHLGTTSACAENTCELPSVFSAPWNYLRVRGEYINTNGHASGTGELPPRARRIP